MDRMGETRTGWLRWRLRLVVAGVVAAAALGGVLAAPGTAASKYSADDCAALLDLSDNIPDTRGSGSSIFGTQAAAVGEGFAQTAQDIENRKLRKAMQQIAAFYEDASDVDNAADAVRLYASSKGRKYAKAFGRWVKAFTTCVVSNITIPSISLPSNVTLPSNITIPNITLPSGVTVPR